VTGVVQGVGFRPFVYRLANDLGLSGFVGNDSRAVFIEVQGAPGVVDEFARRLVSDRPPLAFITGLESGSGALQQEAGFRIVPSADARGARTLVPADVATCPSCLAELFDPNDRRYRHPFITCTDCGPRFTIIRDLPYDRPATTMADFAMCGRCAIEYGEPANRRFHAQPVACHDCGPTLWFEYGATRIDGTDAAIAAAQRALAVGDVVAIKGVGGYHLACRADDAGAVARLRERKGRDQKPFALMTRDATAAGRLVAATDEELRLLTGPARPIVLLPRLENAPVADAVAPGNPLLGVMLPYTPVHHLLFAPVPGFDVPPPAALVLTSANISDEPLCFDDIDAATRLPHLADALLTHDRPIHVPCDDSVVRVIDGAELPIRRSRGYAPLPVPLRRQLPTTLAVGAELKNTCCLVEGENAFCSAHVGDMGNLETLRAFDRVVEQLGAIHGVQPEVVAADRHPAYLTRRWAERRAGGPKEPPLHLVQHHHAHVVSLLAERGALGRPVIGVAFDGTGFGDDAAVWGGEILVVDADVVRYRRAGHLRPVLLPGGDAAVRNPCRMAIAYLADAGVAWDEDIPAVMSCEAAERRVVRSQLESGVGTVSCSSMGRLFDAVSALLGVRQRIGYEAQAAIELEHLAASSTAPLPCSAQPVRFDVDAGGVMDHRPVIRALVANVRAGIRADVLARAFHDALAHVVTEAVRLISVETGIRTAGLTGGVFQNVVLTRGCRRGLEDAGLEVLVHEVVPPNDGGLALGQAVVAAFANAGEE
jgi:hydrogenase maturation protein HypF